MQEVNTWYGHWQDGVGVKYHVVTLIRHLTFFMDLDL